MLRFIIKPTEMKKKKVFFFNTNFRHFVLICEITEQISLMI